MAGRLWPWLLLALALLTTLLIRKPAANLVPAEQAQFTLAVLRDPDTLDPALSDRPEDFAIVQNVFETLLRETPTGALVPRLAAGVTAAGRTLTVRLKPARIVNGTPVTAALVAESLARPLWRSVRSPLAEKLLRPVVGESAVIAGKAAYLSGVRVLGRRELTIRVARASEAAAMMAALANPALAIVPVGDQLHGGSNWQFVDLYGSGGWRLTDWAPGNGLVFRRAFGSGPDGVEVTEYPNQKVAELSVVNGAADAFEIGAQALSSVPGSWLRLVRPVRLAGNLILAYRPARNGTSPLAGLPVSRWVMSALRGKALTVSARLPGALPRHLTVAVNPKDPEAVRLAEGLRRLSPAVVVVQAPPANFAGLVARGRVDAVLSGHAVAGLTGSITVAPRMTWWMMPSKLRAAFFADGQVIWHTVAWRS